MEITGKDCANDFFDVKDNSFPNMSNGNSNISIHQSASADSSQFFTQPLDNSMISQSPSDVYGQTSSQFTSHFPSQIQEEPTEIKEEMFDESSIIYEQRGSVILGPGSKKEARLLGLGLSKVSNRQYDDISNAKKYAMEQSIKHVLMRQTAAHQQQQQKMAMYAQALSLMARVYVGSISFELREETIKNAFSPFGPIKSINMSYDQITGHHKGFAFLEFEVPEAATLAQEQMNGVLMGGRNIKVGRPSNMPQAQPIVETIREEAKLCNRIYVSSIHADLNESDVKSVFEAFGNIRNIELAKGATVGKHRGYAYIDYDSDQAAVDAVASMNLFDLGGQFLRVGRAITPPQMRDYIPAATNSTLPTASAVAAAAVTAKLQAIDASAAASPKFTQSPQVIVSGAASPPFGGTPPLGGGQIFVPPPSVVIPRLPTPPTRSPSSSLGSNSPALFPTEFQQSNAIVGQQSLYGHNSMNFQTSPMISNTTSPPPTAYGIGLPDLANDTMKNGGMSRIIILRKMVEPEDVDEALEEEVAGECSKYGRVDRVIVYEDRSSGEVEVKIFVKYSEVQEAENARRHLDGRYFDGRQIEALFYDENLFARGDLSR